MQYIFKIICILQSLYTGRQINRISSHLLFFIAFVLRVDPTLISLYIPSFYFMKNFVVYEINFEHLIGLGTLSCAMCFIIALTLYNRTNHVNVKYHKSPVWNCHSEDKHSISIDILFFHLQLQYVCTILS
jgi:lysylphosphatidylglycerol synthetase-like protein (DUF2156 family)